MRSLLIVATGMILFFLAEPALATCWTGTSATGDRYDFVGILNRDATTKQYLIENGGMHADLSLVLYGTISGKAVAIIPIWSGGSMGISSVLVYQLKDAWSTPLLLGQLSVSSLAGVSFASGDVHFFTVVHLPGEPRSRPTRFADTAYTLERGDGHEYLLQTSMKMIDHYDCGLFSPSKTSH